MRFVHSDDPCGSASKKTGCDVEEPKESGRGSGQEGRSDTLKLKAQHEERQEAQAAGSSLLVQKASLHHTGSPVRGQRSKGAATCSHAAASNYELSLDLKNKQVRLLLLMPWERGLGWAGPFLHPLFSLVPFHVHTQLADHHQGWGWDWANIFRDEP